MAEWTIEFKENKYFRLQDNFYYRKSSHLHLKEIDYCYFTGETLDFIECKEVKNPINEKIECALKGVHSLALVKTGLLEKNQSFLSGINNLEIPLNIRINMYFVFNANYEQKSQLIILQSFIEKQIKCFSLLWNINEIKVMSFDQSKKKLNYIISERYL